MLATICLFPVDIALVSTTVDRNSGIRKPWASPERVANIVFSLKIVYYSIPTWNSQMTYVVLYAVDALFCLLIIPFSYFWYEEWDEDSTLGSRIRGALKYSILFLAITVALLLTGFFVPISKDLTGHIGLDYLKNLLSENRTLPSFANTHHRRRESSFVRIRSITFSGNNILRCVYGYRLRDIPNQLDQAVPNITNKRHGYRSSRTRP